MDAFLERLAQLVEVDAIAVLEAHPALSKQEVSFQPAGAWGRLATQWLEHDLPSRLLTGDEGWLPPEAIVRLGLDPVEHCCLVQPVRQNGNHLGAVVAVAARARPHSDRRDQAIDLLEAWGIHELGSRRKWALTRDLSARHVRKREHERLNLATRIHDDLSQNLTAIRLTLSTLQRQLGRGDYAKVDAELKELALVSSQIAESVQGLSTSLRPAMIETVGPAAAFNHRAKRHAEAAHVDVDCRVEDVRMSGAVSLAAFRVLEHALDNSLHHAAASRVGIHLYQRGDENVLEVADDGRGFDSSTTRNSLGLLSMAERAEMAGGRLDIDSSPGRGTRVIATFPVSPSQPSSSGRQT